MITLVLGGDVNVQGRAKPSKAFEHLLPLLQGADLRFVNLEGPLDAAMAEALTSGWSIHVRLVRQRPHRADTTLPVLDHAGIAHCGAGLDLATAHAPRVL